MPDGVLVRKSDAGQSGGDCGVDPFDIVLDGDAIARLLMHILQREGEAAFSGLGVFPTLDEFTRTSKSSN